MESLKRVKRNKRSAAKKRRSNRGHMSGGASTSDGQIHQYADNGHADVESNDETDYQR